MPANGMPTGTIHTMVRLDKVASSYHGNMETVVNANADMDNGCIVMLGDLVPGEINAYQVRIPDANSILTDEVLLVKSPEFNGPNYYPNTTLKDFYNPQGSYARAYHLTVGDEFTITTNGITGTPAVDQYLIPQAGSLQLTVAPNLSGGTRFAAKITNTNVSFGYVGSGLTKQSAITVKVVKA